MSSTNVIFIVVELVIVVVNHHRRLSFSAAHAPVNEIAVFVHGHASGDAVELSLETLGEEPAAVDAAVERGGVLRRRGVGVFRVEQLLQHLGEDLALEFVLPVLDLVRLRKK